jgi:hypothetical protein
MYLPTLNIEFIPTFDSRVMLISDASVWLHLQGEQTFLDITTPGRTGFITIPFTKDKITSLNSNNLDITCADDESGLISLPDGVYTIVLKVCDGEKFSATFYYLRTVQLEIRLDNILIKNTIDNCSDNKNCLDLYFNIRILIDSAHAHTRRGNIKEASYRYNRALDMVEDLEECSCDGK